MHPAPSVIVFTVLSGIGFGYLAMLGLGFGTGTGLVAFFQFALGYALAVIGLMASTFHLGNPQRAWRAFTQWKTSWLSREGWASVIALTVLAPSAIGSIWFGILPATLGFTGAALAMVTVFCTSMIYAQLRTVPRWNHWTVPALFLMFALTGGTILAGLNMAAVGLCLLLAALMLMSWRLGDTRFAERGSTMETATGLGGIGRVRLFEPPHTGTNYLMREMIHVVGRRHAQKLRMIALFCAALLPAALLALLPPAWPVTVLVTTLHLIGAFAQRWLFFAEAEHVVGLYYGRRGATA